MDGIAQKKYGAQIEAQVLFSHRKFHIMKLDMQLIDTPEDNGRLVDNNYNLTRIGGALMTASFANAIRFLADQYGKLNGKDYYYNIKKLMSALDFLLAKPYGKHGEYSLLANPSELDNPDLKELIRQEVIFNLRIESLLFGFIDEAGQILTNYQQVMISVANLPDSRVLNVNDKQYTNSGIEFLNFMMALATYEHFVHCQKVFDINLHKMYMVAIGEQLHRVFDLDQPPINPSKWTA